MEVINDVITDIDHNNSGLLWKEVLRTKKRPNESITLSPAKRSLRDPRLASHKTENEPITVSNRFQSLSSSVEEPMSPSTEESNSRPPPIFLHSEVDYSKLAKYLVELVGNENFSCKSSSRGIAIYPKMPSHYRLIVKTLRENGAEFHTFQLRDDKTRRVVLRGLHQSVPEEDIQQELQTKGFAVRKVTNILSRNKEKLPLFFVDFEPGQNINDVFKIKYLLYSKIEVEEPRHTRKIVQCLRCQRYGHTRSYCTLPPRCVRCAGPHETTSCTKPRDTPATCALCLGSHPSNYRGCKIHKELRNNRKGSTFHQNSSVPSNTTPQPTLTDQDAFPSLSNHHSISTEHRTSTRWVRNGSRAVSYSNAVSGSNQQDITSDFPKQLTDFMSDMKSLITPMVTLMSQLIQILIQNNAKK
jgi:hypothetical protein